VAVHGREARVDAESAPSVLKAPQVASALSTIENYRPTLFLCAKLAAKTPANHLRSIDAYLTADAAPCSAACGTKYFKYTVDNYLEACAFFPRGLPAFTAPSVSLSNAAGTSVSASVEVLASIAASGKRLADVTAVSGFIDKDSAPVQINSSKYLLVSTLQTSPG
jgi:hypothetical protein